jgi:uncharacterized membrane protein
MVASQKAPVRVNRTSILSAAPFLSGVVFAVVDWYCLPTIPRLENEYLSSIMTFAAILAGFSLASLGVFMGSTPSSVQKAYVQLGGATLLVSRLGWLTFLSVVVAAVSAAFHVIDVPAVFWPILHGSVVALVLLTAVCTKTFLDFARAQFAAK